jgi:hypothetical protein
VNVDTLKVPSVSLDGYLLGVRRHRTLVGVAYLVVVGAMIVASTTVARATIGGVRVATAAPGGDLLHWALIVAVVVSTFVAPVAYALYNGGPALAALIGVWPELVVYALTGTIHLTADVALGVAFGAFASVLALYAASYRLNGLLAPGADARLDDALLFATAATVVACVAVARLYVDGPAEMATRAEPYSLIVVPTVALIGHCWTTRGR